MTGVGAGAALSALSAAFAAGSADPADPACAAHLHCPPLAVAVAADLVAATVNASLDSWDQGPAAIAVEDHVLAALAGLIGLDPRCAAGAMTSGGTASNLTALHLAREHAGTRPRILCSALAHFSIARAASILGLGEDAVVCVAVDDEQRMSVVALGAALAVSDRPCVVVATAGTTENRLRRGLAGFAERVLASLDELDFDGRQRLLRMVVEKVRVTGWRVEIHLKIPLTDDDPGTQREPRTPKPGPRPSSDNGLRSVHADHRRQLPHAPPPRRHRIATPRPHRALTRWGIPIVASGEFSPSLTTPPSSSRTARRASTFDADAASGGARRQRPTARPVPSGKPTRRSRGPHRTWLELAPPPSDLPSIGNVRADQARSRCAAQAAHTAQACVAALAR